MSGPNKKIALLFRTHVFDEIVLDNYRHLVAHAPKNVDVFFLCDETAGELVVPDDVRKFSHTKEFSRQYRLLNFLPNKHLWYNGDYPFYFFYDAYPAYDLYMMVEFDVYFTNKAVKAFYKHIVSTDADLHGVYFKEAAKAWIWRQAASAFNATVYQIFGPVIGLSNRAVARLYMKRVLQTQRYQNCEVSVWPNCEAFIPTEVVAAGFSVDSLDQSLKIAPGFFGAKKLILADSLSRDENNAQIRHPVLNREAFLPKLRRIAGQKSLPEFLQDRPRLVEIARSFDEAEVRARLGPIMKKEALHNFIEFLKVAP